MVIVVSLWDDQIQKNKYYKDRKKIKIKITKIEWTKNISYYKD